MEINQDSLLLAKRKRENKKGHTLGEAERKRISTAKVKVA